MSSISFESVSREYIVGGESVKALSNTCFSVEEGQFAVILGPSGSGKSTTLNLLGGMDRVTSGNIIVDGKDITTLSVRQLTNYRRVDVGFVFQFYNLIPNLNCYENVDIAAKLSRNPLNAKEVLNAVGLGKRMKHFPAEMSGGELQRASIARALCKNPKLLLCDEPTGALDSTTGIMILSLLKQMCRKYGKTVIVVTHNTSIAPAADRVIHLKDGCVIKVEDNTLPLSMEKVVW
ncbi:ABC transporter ATP-binding protein [Aceticella autotrophica]|uniref:ABC transporter ATP-binding protein n=2 Tax=Aceticella autotrophica TaxID=2755338 RepID=A0A975AXF7_9THEO|nr:ABC transporter ATP-binding protein [Aceticella autotrophica]